jgi:pimeloyl-ACP methyl ester carboxylesterase
MPVFEQDGVEIAYLDEGEGDPILLIHGFASNKAVNWQNTGWIDLFVKEGRRVIALDNRGHGDSQKFHDPEAYGAPIMAEDARKLLDHLGIEQTDVMGYSMGARISAFLTLNHPQRVKRAIFSGLGYGMIEGVGRPGADCRRARGRPPAGRHGPDGPGVSCVRRADQIRPAGPCRLHALLATEDQRRRYRAHRAAGSGGSWNPR